MAALDEVVRAGKARYVGASSMYAWQFAKAQYTARAGGWTPFVSMQNHYNLVYREEEREMIPFCRDQGVGVIPWSPLARGLLAGTWERGGERRTVRSARRHLRRVALRRGRLRRRGRRTRGREGTRRPARPGRARLAARPAGGDRAGVGATKLRHLEDALASVDLVLSEEETARLEAPYRPHPVRGHE